MLVRYMKANASLTLTPNSIQFWWCFPLETFYYIYLGHTFMCSGLTSSSVFKDHSWWNLGYHMRCWLELRLVVDKANTLLLFALSLALIYLFINKNYSRLLHFGESSQIQHCSGVTPGPTLKNYSWWIQEDIGCQGLNLSQLSVRQIYPMLLSDTFSQHQTIRYSI